MQIKKFYCGETVQDIQLAAPGAAYAAMPFGSAYMYSGNYELDGQVWDCNAPGLYRFKVEAEQFFRLRIVLGPMGAADLYAIVSAMCWNHVHGAEDESSNLQAVSNKGKYQRWRLRCGVIAALAAWLLPQVGFTARTVNVSTTGPKNGYDDGHIVLEVLHAGQWRMFDMTNGCYWTDSSGNHLSTAQFINHIAGGSPMPQKIRLDGDDSRWQVSPIAMSGGVLDLGLYGAMVIGDPSQQEAWLRRIFQAIV